MSWSYGARIRAGRGPITVDASGTDTTIYQNTSGRRFHAESIIVTNLSSQSRFYLFDAESAASTKRLDILVKAQTTLALREEELRGGPQQDFVSGVVAGAESESGLIVSVGGYEY